MTRTFDAGTSRPALPGEGETWNRNDSASGRSVLLYTLRQDGWRKGQPVMVNDVTIHIEAANGSETPIGPIADRVLASLAPLASGETETRKALEAARYELRSVLSWNAIEKTMLRPKECESIHATLTAIEVALASEDMQGWRTDMENAPTNNAIQVHVPHLDYYGNEGVYAAMLVDMGTGRRWMTFGWAIGRDLGPENEPDAWRPLPAPPAPETRT